MFASVPATHPIDMPLERKKFVLLHLTILKFDNVSFWGFMTVVFCRYLTVSRIRRIKAFVQYSSGTYKQNSIYIQKSTFMMRHGDTFTSIYLYTPLMVNCWFGAFSGLGPSNRLTPKNPIRGFQESKSTGPKATRQTIS